MPKFIDNYIIEAIKGMTLDSMQYYSAKQVGTNKKFILKRFKTTPFQNSLSMPAHYSPSNLSLFQKLTNESNQRDLFQRLFQRISKIRQFRSVCGCLRQPTTFTLCLNGILLLHFNNIQNQLPQIYSKVTDNINKEIKISTQILSILDYIHKKNVFYGGINTVNIKIDQEAKLYFTNFKESILSDRMQEKLKSLISVKKQRQFKSLLIEDVFDVGKVLFEIFEFTKTDPKYFKFINDKQIKIYQILLQITQKKIGLNDLQRLIEIMNQKQQAQTTARTETSQSLISSYMFMRSLKKGQSLINLSTVNMSQFNNPSIPKLQLRSSVNQSSVPESTKVIVRQNSNISLTTSTRSNLKSSNRLSLSNQLHQLYSKIQKKEQQNKQNLTRQIMEIVTQRKLINLVLYCVDFIEKRTNQKLVFLLVSKCEELSLNIQKSIEKCLHQSIDDQKKQFLKIVKKQNIRTGIIISMIKQSLKNLINDTLLDGVEYCKALDVINISEIERNLSNQVYKYLQKQLFSNSNSQSELETQSPFSLSTKEIQLSKIDSLQKIKNQETLLFSQKKKNQDLYEKFKVCYYLSIKLKYASFQKFFEKKNNFQTQQFNLFKEDYFQHFEAKTVSVKELCDEVLFRVDRFGKRERRSTTHVGFAYL